jgi:ATP/maltotriose-dependent transcriptional regulator MalT
LSIPSADARRDARACYERQSWREARDLLLAADREAPLSAEDLDRLAVSSYMLGFESEGYDVWARAHHAFVSQGEVEGAAASAFRIGFGLLAKGQHAHGSGWLARARRVLDDAGADSVVRGFLLMPDGIRAGIAGDYERAYALFSEALAIGQRFGDADLVAFARQGQGRALIKQGKVAEGVALLDEVMVAVTAGELKPMSTGDIYCSVIDACSEIFDLQRAHEWTTALDEWCASQSEQIPFRGSCLIHRAEILQLRGSWSDALREAERACERLVAPPPRPSAGRAFYQRGELHRLRGEFDEAEAAYRQASELGRKPQPGLALLRLAQGDIDAAVASIRRAVEETRDLGVKARALCASVEILLATNDIPAARDALARVSEMADLLDAPFLRALRGNCAGAIALAENDPEAALTLLQPTVAIWRDLAAPYEEARTRMLLALASRAVGDEDTADLELEAARGLFERVGAASDVARVTELLIAGSRDRSSDGRVGGAGPTRLTSRELEVLGLIATGATNRAIADALGLSEKTVARHVSNIFVKLGLSSRAAATAYAYQHKLV